jgi:sulfatase maturation enzyme AslB (radical SAM superfamily)
LPNIICTYRCNQNCSFCFAGKINSDITYNLEIIKKQYSFIETFDRESVNLVGGEPTLNPEFIPILRWLTEKKPEINIFTNGIIDTAVTNTLKTLNLEKVRFYVNRSEINASHKVYDFYRSLGHLIHLALTVYHPGQELSHIMDEITKFRLLKEFRIGIALPIYKSRDNTYLKPVDYNIVAQELILFFEKCFDAGIAPIFDCGFPYCFFSDKQKEFLERNSISFSSNCGIIPDMNADNQLIPCFPLSNYKFDFSDAEVWEKKEKEIQTLLNTKTRNPLFEKCKTCDEIAKGNCMGGCLSMQLT